MRCFKHLEGICKVKRREIEIRQEKQKSSLSQQVFCLELQRQRKAILDSVDQVDLRKRLDISKAEVESREREVLKREDETYKFKLWSYLDVCYEMVAFHMLEGA